MDKIVLNENQALLEGKRIPIIETLSISFKSVEVIESQGDSGSKDGKLRRAIVGVADKLNGNQRVYTTAEWMKNIQLANEVKCPQGTMLGAVDHVGSCEGGNLKNSPIIWRSLSKDDQGVVRGEFQIVETQAGTDLIKMIDAGAKIGFSTMGYANGREPTDAEKAQYGIASDNEDAVIIENWDLVKIDAVDNPSVRTARLEQNSGVQPVIKGNEMEIKTIEELNAQFKDLLASNKVQIVSDDLVTKAASDAAALVAAEAKIVDLDKTAKLYGALVDKLSESLTCLAEVHGAKRPFREVTTAEAQAAADALTAKLTQVEKDLETAKAEAKANADKLAAIESEKAELVRKESVAAALKEALKDNKFSDVIEASFVNDKSQTVESVKAYVAAKTAEYEKVAGQKTEPVKENILGKIFVPPTAGESEQKSLPAASALAESL